MYVVVRLNGTEWQLVGSYQTWQDAIAAQSRYGGVNSFVWTLDEWLRAKGVQP